MTRPILLMCGVAASVLYIVADVLGAMHFPGYSYTAQTISELSAIDAPSRSLMVPLYIFYDVLLLAFAVGVWQMAVRSRSLQITALMLMGIAVVGVAWGPFFPMHLRGVLATGGKTFTDTMHIVGANVTVPLILIAIGFGSAAFGKRVRIYSIATILVLFICGVLTWVQAPRLAANLPTPWMGVFERINVFGFMLWNAVLAMRLLRGPKTVHAAATVPRAA